MFPCLWYIVYLSNVLNLSSKTLSRWRKLQDWTCTAHWRTGYPVLQLSNIGLLRWMQQRRLQKLVDWHVELKLLNRDQCAPVSGSCMGYADALHWLQAAEDSDSSSDDNTHLTMTTQTTSPSQNVQRQTQLPPTSTTVKFVLWPTWGLRAVAVRMRTLSRESRQQGRTRCRLSSLPAKTRTNQRKLMIEWVHD